MKAKIIFTALLLVASQFSNAQNTPPVKKTTKLQKEITLSKEEKKILKEQERALKVAKKEQKALEKSRKKAEKEQKNYTKKLKKIASAEKSFEKAKKKLASEQKSFEKNKIKYDKNTAKGSLTATEVANQNMKLNKQQIKIKELEANVQKEQQNLIKARG